MTIIVEDWLEAATQERLGGSQFTEAPLASFVWYLDLGFFSYSHEQQGSSGLLSLWPLLYNFLSQLSTKSN